jgi:hypothetical protein
MPDQDMYEFGVAVPRWSPTRRRWTFSTVMDLVDEAGEASRLWLPHVELHGDAGTGVKATMWFDPQRRPPLVNR